MAGANNLFTVLDPTLIKVPFETLSGGLIVERDGAALKMDFPAHPPVQIAEPGGLEAALGVQVLEAWAGPYLVAVVKSEADVRAARPDLAALSALGHEASGGPGNIAIVALADPGKPYAVVSRFFAPGSGIPEDPATGSLHCILAPLYAQKLGRDRIAFHQAYPGRGGDLDCEWVGSRVLLRGQAQTVIESRLWL